MKRYFIVTLLTHSFSIQGNSHQDKQLTPWAFIAAIGFAEVFQHKIV